MDVVEGLPGSDLFTSRINKILFRVKDVKYFL